MRIMLDYLGKMHERPTIVQSNSLRKKGKIATFKQIHCPLPFVSKNINNNNKKESV